MRSVIAAPTQILASFTREEMTALAACVDEMIGARESTGDRAALQMLQSDLKKCLAAPVARSTEVFDAWRDGFSIQLKAVSAFGDPADLSAGEVKSKLLPLIEEAERIA